MPKRSCYRYKLLALDVDEETWRFLNPAFHISMATKGKTPMPTASSQCFASNGTASKMGCSEGRNTMATCSTPESAN
jgi:hypothetical protein